MNVTCWVWGGNHKRTWEVLVHLELKTGKVSFESKNDMVRFHVKCQSFYPIDKLVKFGFVRQKDMSLILRAIFWYVILLMAMFWIRYFTHDHFFVIYRKIKFYQINIYWMPSILKELHLMYYSWRYFIWSKKHCTKYLSYYIPIGLKAFFFFLVLLLFYLFNKEMIKQNSE